MLYGNTRFFVQVFGSLKIYHHTTFIARRRLLYTSDRLKVHAGIPQTSKKSLANVGEQFPWNCSSNLESPSVEGSTNDLSQRWIGWRDHLSHVLISWLQLVSPLTLKNRFNSSQSEQNRISSDTNACEGLWENLEHSARSSWESDLKPMSCDTNRRRLLHDLIGSSAYIYNVNPQSRSTFRCATFWTKHSSFTPFVFF